MRRFIFLFITALSTGCIAASCASSGGVPKTAAHIYFADAELNRLIAYDTELTEADTQSMARELTDKLIEGRDYNDKIRRLIPKEKDALSVETAGDIAYVDIKPDIADKLPQSRDIERLVIYQIVNSLTELKGIRFVKFTIGGEIHKDFMGYYDMRETYKFTYPE